MSKQQTLQEVDIHLLFESPTNPRKTFDKTELAELAASIKQQGVLQNLVIRPSGDKFEIVAGARRFKASLLAGLDKVPAAIRDLTDEEVLDIQIVENLLRKDVHPIEEAEGYQNLINSNRHLTVPEIALKVCKSETYIYQRLKLNELTDDCKTLFRKDLLTIGHSILLARLQPSDQQKALKYITYEYDDINDVDEVDSLITLSNWIENNIMLDLTSAPFKKDDEELVPAAGSCLNCPKRTGFNQTLFPDIIQKDTCTDPACFNNKKEQFVENKIKELTSKDEVPPVRISSNYHGAPKGVLDEQKYRKVKKTECASVEVGIVVHGNDFGKKLFICRDKDCAQHWGKNKPQSNISKPNPEEQKKKQDQIRVRMITALSAAANAKDIFSDLELKTFISDLWTDSDSDCTDFLCMEYGWVKPGEKIDYYEFDKQSKNLSSAKLMEILRFLLLEKTCSFYHSDPKDNLSQIAKSYKVDLKAIEKRVAEERKTSDAAEEVAASQKSKSKTTSKK